MPRRKGKSDRPFSPALEVDAAALVSALEGAEKKAANKVVRKAERKGATVVSKRGKQTVPKRTGQLMRSVRPGANAKLGGFVRAGNRKAVPYAKVIHFGWAKRGIRPQPFLYEALDDRRNEVVAEFDKQLETMLKEQGLL